jgi:hypothetical protein
VSVGPQAELTSILQAPMLCQSCGAICRLAEAIPCIGPNGEDGTGYGCPQPDCGGILTEVRPVRA